MGYKTAPTSNRVHLIHLHRLSALQRAACERLRAEAGRCWTDLVAAHVANRDQGVWLKEADLKQMSKGGMYRLHSQSVQALAEKLIANLDTARALRKQHAEAGLLVEAQYPYKPKPYQTVTWKDQAVRRGRGTVILPNGRGQADLVLPLPKRLHAMSIRKVELLWRADHYELALTVEIPNELGERTPGPTVGVDLGEINIAAAVTNSGQGLVINGRYLRSIKRLRNKCHAELTRKRAWCVEGSRRWTRLNAAKARASATFYRQQRHVLHTASARLIRWIDRCAGSHIAVGDVRDIADGTDNGRKQNQKLSQWAHGQFVGYLTYKARRLGMTVNQIDEAYSTRTCSACGWCHARSSRGRVFRCQQCQSVLHRDANGAANICSKAITGVYGNVQPVTTMYRRATDVAPRTRATLLRERVAGQP
ncbi:MAG: transposase [Chloroflexota bacterium]|nr:transposase [Chloroflexota bacterium]